MSDKETYYGNWYPAEVWTILPRLSNDDRNGAVRLQVSLDNMLLTFYNQQPVKFFLGD